MKPHYHIVIIPDIHLKHEFVGDFLSSCTYDKAIFLGDYFDDFGDEPWQNKITAKWLKESIYVNNHIHLIGNHDLPYMFNGEGYLCSGFDYGKNKVINKVLRKYDWAQLKLFHIEQINGENWLFSHAGFTNSWITENTDNPITMLINEEEWFDHVLSKQLIVENSLFRNVSPRSGGSHKRSGLLWCRTSEFTPIKELNQVFGHTPTLDLIPVEIYPKNWAIDTHLNYICTMNEQGVMTTHEIN